MSVQTVLARVANQSPKQNDFNLGEKEFEEVAMEHMVTVMEMVIMTINLMIKVQNKMKLNSKMKMEMKNMMNHMF